MFKIRKEIILSNRELSHLYRDWKESESVRLGIFIHSINSGFHNFTKLNLLNDDYYKHFDLGLGRSNRH